MVGKSRQSTSQKLNRTRIFADPNPHESVQIRVRFFEEEQEGDIADQSNSVDMAETPRLRDAAQLPDTVKYGANRISR